MLTRSVSRTVARFAAGTPSTFNRAIRLAEEANRRPDDAIIQAAFLKELNAVDPTAVIKRVESRVYATNEAVTKEYIRALQLAGQMHTVNLGQVINQDENVRTTAAITPSDASPSPAPVAIRAPGGGTQIVKLQLEQQSNTQEFWTTVKVLGSAFVIVSGITYLWDSLQPSNRFGVGEQEYRPTQMGTKSFKDIKGCDEVIDEMQEIVSFLKSPDSYTRLGGRLPKGILMTGPPGTGKTLLARAVAGEAGVPFYYASGSEFEEVFVGVGAKRMRSIFATAKQHAPCIIFIDEIDAVGGKRNPRDTQSSKMTLNQMLVEMDGFEGSSGVIVMGATNFQDLLDPALVRPGRFDRTVTVQPPDLKGREDILTLYLNKIKINKPEFDKIRSVIARGTSGFTGAELENLVNTGSLHAASRNASSVALEDLEYARDKIIMGPEKKSYRTTQKGRECTAQHEAGHALMAVLTPGADPIYKATIMPRGQALGMVQQLPEQDRYSYSRLMMQARLDVLMGGRVAEELFLGSDDYTSGPSSDLQQATELASAMIKRWGLSERVGPIFYENDEDIGPAARKVIDDEVRTILQESYNRAKMVLTQRRKEHQALAQALLERETLEGEEIEAIVHGKSIWSKSWWAPKPSAPKPSTASPIVHVVRDDSIQ